MKQKKKEPKKIIEQVPASNQDLANLNASMHQYLQHIMNGINKLSTNQVLLEDELKKIRRILKCKQTKNSMA